jgi:hypothetical protein
LEKYSWKIWVFSERGVGIREDHALLGLEDGQRSKPEITHPSRFALHLGNLPDDFCVESLAGLEHILGVRVEIVC